MENLKELKVGELIFKEGQKLEAIYLIKSGRLSLFQERSGNKIEIQQALSGQIIGESALFGIPKSQFSASALIKSSVLEIPLQLIQSRIDLSDPIIKIFIKGLGGVVNDIRNQVRSMKLELDNSPCPQKMIPRVFGLIGIIGSHFGQKKENITYISWNSLRVYSHRMFLESVDRVRGALDLLKKLKYLDFEFTQTEEGETVLDTIKVINPRWIEEFADFYQYHFYKSGRSEVIYVDPLAMQITEHLMGLAKDEKADHRGNILLEYEKVLLSFKEKLRLDFKSTHLDLLEKKGLLVQRKSIEKKGIYLTFNKDEFEKTLPYWKVLYEIDLWNAKGFVDMNENIKPKESDAHGCPECHQTIQSNQKFCANCGAKLAA